MRIAYSLGMTNDLSLDAAFSSTRYEIDLPNQQAACVVRIAQPVPDALTAWIAGYSRSGTAWIITADNPDAAPCDDAFNSARRWALDAMLKRPGVRWLATQHRAGYHNWPVEHGRLITGLETGLALALGRRFGQLAVVALPAGQPAQLVWLTRV